MDPLTHMQGLLYLNVLRKQQVAPHTVNAVAAAAVSKASSG